MAYIKHNWQDFEAGGTLVTAQKLNEMEEGIETANEMMHVDVDTELSETSENPVANNVLARALRRLTEAVNSIIQNAVVNVDTSLSTTSTNPVQNKVVTNAIRQAGGGLTPEIVQTLPATGETGILYLLAVEQTEVGNLYDEYLWIPSQSRFERLGSRISVDNELSDESENPVQNRVIKSELDGKVSKAGDTMSGALNFANETWNALGDDVQFGDQNIAGKMVLQGLNGDTGLRLYKEGDTDYYADIYFDGEETKVEGLNAEDTEEDGKYVSSVSQNDGKISVTRKTLPAGGGVQSDWNEADTKSAAYIKNKPTIPEQVQADWDVDDREAPDYIKNKPSLNDFVKKEGDVMTGSLWVGDDADSATRIEPGKIKIGDSTDAGYRIEFGDSVNCYIEESSDDEMTIHASNIYLDGSVYVDNDELAKVATSGSYNDLANKPTIPAKVLDLDTQQQCAISYGSYPAYKGAIPNSAFSGNGLNICQGADESSGIRFDGNKITMWSPCDDSTSLQYFDEDEDDTTPIWKIDSSGNFSGKAANVTGTVAVVNGGTGAANAASARSNLGLGGAATYGATTSVSNGSNSLVTSGAVYTAFNTSEVYTYRTGLVLKRYGKVRILHINGAKCLSNSYVLNSGTMATTDRPTIEANARGYMLLNNQYYNIQLRIYTTGEVRAWGDNGNGGSWYNVGTNYEMYGEIVWII